MAKQNTLYTNKLNQTGNRKIILSYINIPINSKPTKRRQNKFI